jgi:hypothetical protein
MIGAWLPGLELEAARAAFLCSRDPRCVPAPRATVGPVVEGDGVRNIAVTCRTCGRRGELSERLEVRTLCTQSAARVPVQDSTKQNKDQKTACGNVEISIKSSPINALPCGSR